MIRPRKPMAVTKIRDARIDTLARQSDIEVSPEREKVLAEIERAAWRAVQITARRLASEALAKWRAVKSLR